jgi:hypothetical protein
MAYHTPFEYNMLLCRRKFDVLSKSAKKSCASWGVNVRAMKPSTRMSLAWTRGFVCRIYQMARVMIRRAGTSSPEIMACLMKFTEEEVSNKYYWLPPHISRKMDDPKRTYVETEKFLRVGEPNTRQEPHPRHSNVR